MAYKPGLRNSTTTSATIPKPISNPDATLGPDDLTQCLKRGVVTVSFPPFLHSTRSRKTVTSRGLILLLAISEGSFMVPPSLVRL